VAPAPLGRRCLAESLGSALLVAVVVGSGIAAQRLSPDDVGLQLAENALATAAGLFAIILVVGPVSGAHLNPVVSIADVLLAVRDRRASRPDAGGLPARDLVGYLPAQLVGAVGGCVLANLLFALPAATASTTTRSAGHLRLSEVVATAGLLLVIFSLGRTGRAERAPAAVGAYIGAAYFFTSSTSFANPAVTVGRAFTGTFAGIAPHSVLGFLLAQLVGLVVGLGLVVLLHPVPVAGGDQVLLAVDHEPETRP
jgi:glycerol uptake facilitator-like aquaporin